MCTVAIEMTCSSKLHLVGDGDQRACTSMQGERGPNGERGVRGRRGEPGIAVSALLSLHSHQANVARPNPLVLCCLRSCVSHVMAAICFLAH